LLFIYTLQNIDFNKERELLIQCTSCSYNKIVKIPGFQSSNFVPNYKNKHLTIVYNEKTKKKKLLKKDVSSKPDFFNI